jgi:enamine deaminase RidA (YjgF/YER057c/UK114 family)
LNGTPAGGPIAEQTRVTLQNLAGILEQLGPDASSVVSCTCHLAVDVSPPF